MGPIQAIKTCFSKYGKFDGRAQRSEYWWWQLLAAIVMSPFIFASESGGSFSGIAIASLIGLLAILVPTIAVTVRRLHDMDKPGWWYFINFIPYVGGLVLMVICIRKGTDGSNQYGDDPLKPSAQELEEVFS